MLEVATERMFVEPSILDTIASVASAMCQYEMCRWFYAPRRAGGNRGRSRGVRGWRGVGRGRARAITD
jgi:hypothetical protein